VLLVFILYLTFWKRPKKERSELTDADIDELVAEWKPVRRRNQLVGWSE
jgi:hypothetical protein